MSFSSFLSRLDSAKFFGRYLKSPISADNNDVFPDPTSPKIPTNLPFFIFRFIFFRQRIFERILSSNIFFSFF